MCEAAVEDTLANDGDRSGTSSDEVGVGKDTSCTTVEIPGITHDVAEELDSACSKERCSLEDLPSKSWDHSALMRLYRKLSNDDEQALCGWLKARYAAKNDQETKRLQLLLDTLTYIKVYEGIQSYFVKLGCI